MESINKTLESSGNISILKRIGCTLLCLIAFVLLRIPTEEVTSQFAKTFSGFGTELSAFTQWMLTVTPIYTFISYLSAIPLLIWLTFLFHPEQQKILFKLGLFNFLLSVVLIVAFFVAMYLPIFSLGAIV